MKKRIISLILVVVMATLSLASCTFNLANEDLSKYATFNAEEFGKIFEGIEIEDGDFTVNEETREKKIADYIYAEMISAGSDAKTEGSVDANDVLTYAYYSVVTKDGIEIVAKASNMSLKNSNKIQLDDSDLTTRSDFEKVLKEKIVAHGEIKNNVYATTTSGNFADGDIAYITYSVKVGETTTKFTNVKVTLSANIPENGEHQVVVDKLLENKETATIGGTALASFDVESKNYSGAKVDWTVNKVNNAEPVAIEMSVTLTEDERFLCVDGDTEVVKKDTTVKYFVYPVSYVAVDNELTAEVVLGDIYNSDGTFKCFKDKKDLIEDYTTKKSLYDSLESSHKHEDGESETAHDEINKAKAEADAARDAFMAAVGSTETLVTEYEKGVRESLLNDYNAELKVNMADVIWDAMVANVTINDCPKKLIRAIYEIMYDNYEHTFYTEEGSEDSDSPYKKHEGSFESYLAEKTKTQGQSLQAAKDQIWANARVHAEKMLIVYVVADHYDQLASKKEIREYKKTSDYKANEASYGEVNTLAAYQMDYLMNNYFLAEITEKQIDDEGKEIDVPVKGENGIVKYQRFGEDKIKFKGAVTE